MRKILCVSILMLVVIVASAQFQVSGKMRVVRPITLTVEDLNGKIVVQCDIVNGKEFSTKNISIIDDLYIMKIGEYSQYILLKNSPLTINGYLNDKDSKDNSLSIKGVDEYSIFAPFAENFLRGGLANLSFEEQKTYIEKALKDNPALDPKIFAATIYIHGSSIVNYEIFKYVHGQQPKNDASVLNKKLSEILAERECYQLNNKAFNWVLVDKDGKKVSLSDFKGKIVILDFWASWCGPCRSEMKSLYKIYDEIKGKDLVFVSVSLDDDRDKWLKAKEEENIPWVSVWDKDGFWDSKIRPKYGFNQIPFIVLIDKEGRTVARRLRGEDVRTEIEKLRKQK